MFKLNKAVVSSFLVASAFLAPATQASEYVAPTYEKDANGLIINPRCSDRDIFVKAMQNPAINKVSTGLRAKTADYDLEIFVKLKKDGTPMDSIWTLAGTNKEGKVCNLKSGVVQKYTQDPYISQLDFKPVGPSVADAKQLPKPQMQ